MRYLALGTRLAAVALLILSMMVHTKAAEPIDVDVVLPLSGGAAFVGQAGQKTLRIEEAIVNKEGGIKGQPLHFTFHDDQTSPQVAVQVTNEITAKRPSVFLGAMLVGSCNAMAPLIKNAGPTMYCLSPALSTKKGEYAFASFLPTTGIAEAVLRYFHARGWNQLGMLYTTDASGQDSERAFDEELQKPEFAGMSVVDREHFNSGDVSIAAQIERLKSAKPEALVAYTTGAAVGTIFRGLTQAGFDVPVATSTGNALYAIVKQFASVLPKQLYFAAGAGTASGAGLHLKAGTIAQKKIVEAALDKIGDKPDFGTEVVWDPAMITVDALRHVGPDASPTDVQKYILDLKSYEGLSGTYDFVKYPMSGLGSENALVVRWNDKQTSFEAVSQPGGEPITQ